VRLAHEFLNGVDFSGLVHPEELGLNPSLAQNSSPSGDLHLKRLLRDLPITKGDSIIDAGCGKGSAIRMMLKFPFERVDGIELSGLISSVARQNFQRLGVPANRCRIINADASRFQELDGYNYVYMFNPFSAEVMAKFLDNLARSVCRAPRQLKIIYCNPVCHDQIVAGGKFTQLGEYPGRKKFYLYSN